MDGLGRTVRVLVSAAAVATVLAASIAGQQSPPQFGGSYAALDSQRQHFVDDWVTRFTAVTGKTIAPAEFYDSVLHLSTKTTFEAITHALLTTTLTDASGKGLGDALALVEHIDGVRGKILGTSGDHQFRMYVRLKEGALDTLARSQQFQRRADNTVFHKGYPINFRGQGGPPSIQVSAALDRRQADIDVDYRSSSFPVALFNGHLSASNSDVRAGNNYDRHSNRWTGLQNWWRNFFGINLPSGDDNQQTDSIESVAPRIGKQPVQDMTADFLKAWLVDGDIKSAMSYISPTALACLTENSDDLSSFDRGMAPFILAHRLKAAHDALGPHQSLDGLVVGVRLTTPGLKVVTQPHHAQFVVYAVPDDVAEAFDCVSQTAVGQAKSIRRSYGTYMGTTFYIKGSQAKGVQAPTTVALMWKKEEGYWRIVSWQTDPDDDDIPVPKMPASPPSPHVPADLTLVEAARRFLESWLVRKDYGTAFTYVSPKAYPCYDLARAPDQPAAASPEDAANKILAGLARTGDDVGKVRSLDDVITAEAPTHPAVRVMDHRYSRTFTLLSVPNGLADAVDCAARLRGEPFSGQISLEYGKRFAVIMRLRTAGTPAVLRTLWAKENDVWRITAYDVEAP